MDWYILYTTHSKHPSSWIAIVLANTICGYRQILAKSYTLVARDFKCFPAPIQYFLMYMDRVKVSAEMSKTKAPKENKGTVRKQKGEKAMDINTLTDKSFDTTHYDSDDCRHQFLLPIGIDTKQINVHNNKYREEYRTGLEEWKSHSTSYLH